jgi:hypothetical protein
MIRLNVVGYYTNRERFNMKAKMVLWGSLVTATFFISGCATPRIDFTAISSKNIDWSRASEYQRTSQRAEGVDKVHIIIFIPTGVPNAKEAMDRAIESVPGAVALIDCVMTQSFWYIPYIYGQASWVVEGTPLIDKRLVSTRTHGEYLVTHVNADGTIRETKAVTKDEYASIQSSAFSQLR